MVKRVSNETKSNIFGSFPNEKKVRKGYLSYRNHRTESVDTFTSVKTAAGAAIGQNLFRRQESRFLRS